MKRKTNIQFLTELMNYGNPLKQAFIMEAVAKYAEKIATDFDADEAEASGKWGMVSPYAWQEVAKEINTAMTERLK